MSLRQSRARSLGEAVTNVGVGYGAAVDPGQGLFI
jgi:hypothetical protein